MLNGDNNILSRATDAKIKTEYGKAQEALSLAYAEAVGDRYLNNSTTALESEVVQKLQNAGYTIGTEASGSAQIELSSTSVILEEGGNTEEVTATIKADTKYMLVDGLYYSLTITNSTAKLGEEGRSDLTGSSISLSDLKLNTTGSITAELNTSTGVITITSTTERLSADEDNDKVEVIYNGTNYGTIDVVLKASLIGDYVNYNVPYTDMYSDTDTETEGIQGYNFTARDGWRILERKINETDLSKYDIKIVSTGIPALLKYHYRTNRGKTTNGWWGTNDQVNALYGSNYSNATEGEPARCAATGLQENFKDIKFVNGTSTSANFGCYLKIGNIDSGDLYGSSFILKNENNINVYADTNVHNLTLSELNKARNMEETNTSIGTNSKDGDIGLFCLNNLETELAVSGYTSSTDSKYWLGGTLQGSGYYLSVAGGNGSINGGSSNAICGVRPVIEILGVTMTQNPTTKVWTITQ